MMSKLCLILLFAIASCTEPLVQTQTLCVRYRIGEASTTATVKFVDGYVVCDNWKLSVTSTPNNKYRLFRDTTLQTEFGTVYSSSTFLFDNNQVSDTIRGIYISHSEGSVCNTYDTLPVTITHCSINPSGNTWH